MSLWISVFFCHFLLHLSFFCCIDSFFDWACWNLCFILNWYNLLSCIYCPLHLSLFEVIIIGQSSGQFMLCWSNQLLHCTHVVRDSVTSLLQSDLILYLCFLQTHTYELVMVTTFSKFPCKYVLNLLPSPVLHLIVNDILRVCIPCPQPCHQMFVDSGILLCLTFLLYWILPAIVSY